MLELANVNVEGRPELVAISNDHPASGEFCLQVKDDPQLKAAYNPHFYLVPSYTEGTAQFKYQIWLEKDAVVQCEWRSKGNPYRVGPSLVFRNGGLFAAIKSS